MFHNKFPLIGLIDFDCYYYYFFLMAFTLVIVNLFLNVMTDDTGVTADIVLKSDLDSTVD